ncbi:hypothetical protein NDU88_006958 [Pleurodeles waltl]|uniref:Secreted protein n=1 Tax=Pleurodeles waltl TaxID=8319 RepID=A0AAV7QJF3_PLEWA|nr:hypothetical protein NDU88_006958 [Pleurodeles waltl]
MPPTPRCLTVFFLASFSGFSLGCSPGHHFSGAAPPVLLLQLPLPLFPRRGIRATLLRVRCSSSAARCHQTAPAVLQIASGLNSCGVHIRVLAAAACSAAATCHAPRNRNRKAP